MLNLYFWLMFATETVNNSKINQTKAASKNINKQQQTPKKENVISQSEHIDIYVHIIDLKVCFSKREKKGKMPHTKKQNTLVLLSNENQKTCYRDLTAHLLNKNFEIAVLRWRTNRKWEVARNMFMNKIELSGGGGETWKKKKRRGGREGG